MLSITGMAGQGRGLFVAALAITTVLACEPKVYPDAQPETRAPLETEILEAEMAPTPVDAGCTPVTLFRDRDGDTYGGDAEEDQIQGCPPMPGYVTRDGDCSDAAPTAENRANFVNPGVIDFFAVGYPTPTGESFDYDCNEREDVDLLQGSRIELPNCSLATPPGCSARVGYVPTERAGLGVSPLCGSEVLILCNPGPNGCFAQNLPTSSPLRCR